MDKRTFSPGPTTRGHGSFVRRVLALLAVLLIAFSSASAFAQEDGDEDVPEGPLGEELEDYWSVDREVDVIKQKLYSREGRFAVGLHAGVMSSEPFFWYLPVGLRLDYYFSDNWGVELEGSYMGQDGIFRHKTDLTNFVIAEQEDSFDPKTDALDQFKWRAHAMAVWHPFYGKIALLQRKLAHFDLNFAAGFGAVSLTRPNKTRDAFDDKIAPEFAFGGGLQFFTSEHVTLRLSGRGYVYPGPMNYKNTDTGERFVFADIDDEHIESANFYQKLEVTTEFLAGVSYMF